MLVIAGDDGRIAGAIADYGGVPPSTMSHRLVTLKRAGLVQSEREGQLIRYRADYPGMRRPLAFLKQYCCGGEPDICADLLCGLDCKPRAKALK